MSVISALPPLDRLASVQSLEPAGVQFGPDCCVKERGVAPVGSESTRWTVCAASGPALATTIMKTMLLPAATELSPSRMNFWTERSATAWAASWADKEVEKRTAPFGRVRFTLHAPRLLTVTPFTTEVWLDGSVNRYSVSGSEDAMSECSTKPAGSTQITRHGKSEPKGAPDAFAQTASPRLKSDFSVPVEQS